MSAAVLFAGAVTLVGATSRAHAQPVTVAGERWDHVANGGTDTFTRADGSRIVVSASAQPCDRGAVALTEVRPPWVPLAYWPASSSTGGTTTLCLALDLTGASATIAITPAAGKPVGPDLAPMLRQLADELRPAVPVPAVGALQPSRPIAQVQDGAVAFLLDDQGAAVVGLEHVDHGACAYDNALVITKVSTIADRPFADGYWPMTGEGGGAVYGCLDLREGFVSVVINPGATLASLADVLADVRRAAYATHGAPLTADAPITLPHTQQRLAPLAGRWKIVDGERYRRPGADVFTTTAALGHDHTLYTVAVSEGPCSAGAEAAPPDVAAALFPREAGPISIDPDPYKLRWTAWACISHGGETATIAVQAPLAGDRAPDVRERDDLRAVVDDVVRSYGLEVRAPVPAPAPSRPQERKATRAIGGAYLGVISLAPDEGDRALGFLVGWGFRLMQRHGLAFTLDLELGRGGGEWIGEIRSGVGLGLGPLDAVVGGAVGSTGPAAAADAYAQLGLTVDLGRPKLWLGGLAAVGLAGPDHQQLDAHLVIPGTDDTGIFLGARYVRFGDTTDDGGATVGNGSALLFLIGGGVASHDR